MAVQQNVVTVDVQGAVAALEAKTRSDAVALQAVEHAQATRVHAAAAVNEARSIAERVSAYLQAHPHRPVLLGGDFNDLRSSDALQPLFALPWTDPMGEQLASKGGNPSTYWPKRRMRLDFLLLSPAAVGYLVPGSAMIHASQQAKRASDHYPVSVDLRFSEV